MEGPVTYSNWCSRNTTKFSSFKFGLQGICLYPEGIASHSPGLPANAGYPGSWSDSVNYPERVASSENSRVTEPLRGTKHHPIESPRVACFARNPGLCDTTPSE